MNDEKNKMWWEIVRWGNGEQVSNWVFAKEVIQTTKWAVIVDGVDLVFDESICGINEKSGAYDPFILSHIFNSYFIFEKNSLETWKRIEEHLPGVVCNREMNTDEVIDRGCVRFVDGGVMLEYNPNPPDGFEYRWVGDPLPESD